MRPPITYALVPYLIGLCGCSSDHGRFVFFSISVSVIAIIYWKIKRKIKKADATRVVCSMGFGVLLVYVSLSESGEKSLENPINSEAMKQLPPRELSLEIKIVSRKKFYVQCEKEFLNYIGIIEKAPELRKDLIGKKVIWSNKWRENLSRIYKDDTISLRSVVTRQSNNNLGNNEAFYKLSYIKFLKIKHSIGTFENLRRLLEEKIIKKNKKGQKSSAFMYALLLGDKAFLDAQQIELYKQAGTMHLFAVSGLHVGILYMLSCFLLRSFITNKILMIVVSLVVVCCYVILVGSSDSAIRSFIMISIWQSSSLFYKKRNSLSALLWASLILLFIDHTKIYSLGYQLSFTVVISLIFSFHGITQRKKNKLYDLMRNSILISFSSFCGSSLLIIDSFHYINPFSIVINSLIVIVIFPIYAFFLLYIITSFIINCEVSVTIIDIIYLTLEEMIIILNQCSFFQYRFNNSHDVPDFIHLTYPLILIFLVKYIHTLKVRLFVLATLPSILLLLNFCLN